MRTGGKNDSTSAATATGTATDIINRDLFVLGSKRRHDDLDIRPASRPPDCTCAPHQAHGRHIDTLCRWVLGGNLVGNLEASGWDRPVQRLLPRRPLCGVCVELVSFRLLGPIEVGPEDRLVDI